MSANTTQSKTIFSGQRSGDGRFIRRTESIQGDNELSDERTLHQQWKQMIVKKKMDRKKVPTI
jgi:hypothetical protein